MTKYILCQQDERIFTSPVTAIRTFQYLGEEFFVHIDGADHRPGARQKYVVATTSIGAIVAEGWATNEGPIVLEAKKILQKWQTEAQLWVYLSIAPGVINERGEFRRLTPLGIVAYLAAKSLPDYKPEWNDDGQLLLTIPLIIRPDFEKSLLTRWPKTKLIQIKPGRYERCTATLLYQL